MIAINRKNLYSLIILTLSAFVFSMAFPGFITLSGISIIALFAFIPIFILLKDTSYLNAGLYGFYYGFLFYIFFNYWLKTFHPLAILIAPIIKGAEMILLFIVLKYANTLLKKRAYILQSLIFVSYYYLTQSWFAGYPYGNIVYALYKWLPLIQIVNLAGIWPLVFIVVLPQAFIANNYKKLKDYKIDIIIYLIFIILVLTYGFINMHKMDNREVSKTFKVATLQHNADNWKGGVTTYRRNFNNLKTMSYRALQKDPDIVVWSETSFVPSVYWHTHYDTDPDVQDLVYDFVDFANSFKKPLLVGNAERRLKDPTKPPVDKDFNLNAADYNATILYQNGELAESYHKQRLVPFTEHFPYEKTLPWIYNFLRANDYQFWNEGHEAVVYETDGVKYSTPICFEDVFGYITADFANKGAQVIINLTNDSWSKVESAEYQHSAMAVFRSIETGLPTIRSTNSGISCMIDSSGRISGILKPFTIATGYYDVPIYNDNYKTLYTKYGDNFVKIFTLLLAIALIVLSILKFKKNGKNS